ncbi:MAG: T4SS guanine nucleotide exchange effector RalF [Candidatus Lariskella arthropodorum]
MHEKFSAEIRSQIAKVFNAKPKNGIAQIKDICNTLQIDKEKQIAAFFTTEKQNLDLSEIGDYLGTKATENQSVLKHFVASMEFKDKPFGDELRDYLKSYKLPGEAQKIDRLVQEFSEAYVQQNQCQDFNHPDAVYLLAFATIMLNTDLHNPSIRNHMSFIQFQNNLKNVNQDKDFDHEFLQHLYQDIKNNPIEMNFVKVPMGMQINSLALQYDKTFTMLSTYIANMNVSRIQDVFPVLNGRDLKIEVHAPESWFSILMGYQGTITVTDKNTDDQVTIQTYKPSIISRLFFNDKPSLIIQPISISNETQLGSLQLAAQCAASFKPEINTFKSTYEYERLELEQAYREAKNIQTKTLSHQQRLAENNLTTENSRYK